MLELFVFAAKIEPAFAVKPIVRIIESAAGTVAPRTKKVAAGADALNSEAVIIAKL